MSFDSEKQRTRNCTMNRLSSLPCSSSVATKIQNSLTILNPCPVYWYDSLNSTMDEVSCEQFTALLVF